MRPLRRPSQCDVQLKVRRLERRASSASEVEAIYLLTLDIGDIRQPMIVIPDFCYSTVLVPHNMKMGTRAVSELTRTKAGQHEQ